MAAFAGCGGGAESVTGTPDTLADPAPLSRAEFVREANRICYSSESRIEAAADDYATRKRPPSRRKVAAIARGVVIPALKTEVQAIEALGAPAGGVGEVRRVLALTRRGIAAIRRDPGGLLDGPPPELNEANRLARHFGAAQCGLRG